MSIHIGKIIHELVKKKGFKAQAVADFVSISQSSLFKIYQRESIDVDKLIKFSQLLDNNLFLNYLNEEPLKSMFGRQVEILQRRISDLEGELNSKNEKLKDLTDIIETQKKVISLHEANSTNDRPKTKSRR